MAAAFITTMVVVANVAGAGMAYPQAARLVRTRNVNGVSGVWAGVSIAMNGWWLVYGVANGLWGLVPVSVIASVLYAVIAVTYSRAVGMSALRALALGGLVLGMVPLPVLLIGGWTAAGIAIGLCYGLQLLPAVVKSFRTSDLRGVASATWLMALVESAIWLVYGLYVTDGALLVGGVAGVAMSAIILVRLSLTGHRPFDRNALTLAA